jgi:heme/copper-type cytochrome/quinol oxidase subunit 2
LLNELKFRDCITDSSEICGINHGFMPIVVEAVDEGDFLE